MSTHPPVLKSSAPFTLAVEYGIFGLAVDYAASGVTYAKPQVEFGIWGNLEPEPGQYHWGPLDALVQEYQSAGFTGLQLLLSAESPWASINPKLNGNTFPKEEYLDDYVRFVTRVVERYDGDGQDDMPGLLHPIHHYGIEREFTGFWPGSAKDYVRLLRLAYPAIHEADEQAEVFLVALLMIDVFDGAPDEAEIAQRFSERQSFRKDLDETLAILAACDAYDIVDFHSLGDYTEIPPTTAWIRSQLASLGCGNKPIWIGDAFSMSALIAYGGLRPPIPLHPATVETRDQVKAILQAVVDPGEPDHAASRDWLQAEMARGLVKKIVVAAGEGLRGINIGNMEDWKTGIPNIDKITVTAIGTSAIMGMMDTSRTNLKPAGDQPYFGNDWSRARKAGAIRPVFYALTLVNQKLSGFSSVEKVPLGEHIWAYRFERPAGPVWVLWLDNGDLVLPGESSPTETVQIPFTGIRAKATRTPLEPGQKQPKSTFIQTSNGMLTLTIGITPLFLEPVP